MNVNYSVKSSFFSSTVYFGPFTQNGEGIRSYHWITAFFLRCVNMITDVKKADGTYLYLNKHRFSEWGKNHNKDLPLFESTPENIINSLCIFKYEQLAEACIKDPKAPNFDKCLEYLNKALSINLKGKSPLKEKVATLKQFWKSQEFEIPNLHQLTAEFSEKCHELGANPFLELSEYPRTFSQIATTSEFQNFHFTESEFNAIGKFNDEELVKITNDPNPLLNALAKNILDVHNKFILFKMSELICKKIKIYLGEVQKEKPAQKDSPQNSGVEDRHQPKKPDEQVVKEGAQQLVAPNPEENQAVSVKQDSPKNAQALQPETPNEKDKPIPPVIEKENLVIDETELYKEILVNWGKKNGIELLQPNEPPKIKSLKETVRNGLLDLKVKYKTLPRLIDVVDGALQAKLIVFEMARYIMEGYLCKFEWPFGCTERDLEENLLMLDFKNGCLSDPDLDSFKKPLKGEMEELAQRAKEYYKILKFAEIYEFLNQLLPLLSSQMDQEKINESEVERLIEEARRLHAQGSHQSLTKLRKASELTKSESRKQDIEVVIMSYEMELVSSECESNNI